MFLKRYINLSSINLVNSHLFVAETAMPSQSHRIALGVVTANNIQQIRRLNAVLFPVHYVDRFYKEVLKSPQYAQLGDRHV